MSTIALGIRSHPVVKLIRPLQWTKNAAVLAGVVFSGQASDPGQVSRALLALVAFCLASSAVYVFNDWHDREEDRLHPTKSRRPIASGEVSPSVALTLAAVLMIAAVSISAVVSRELVGVILLYSGLIIAYTLWLRQFAVLDVLVIALGFVIRAVAGAVAVNVPLSAWLFVCTLLLAGMLGLGKRRQELRLLHGETRFHRPSLAGYSSIDLDRVIIINGGLTAAAYALYAVAVPTYGRDLPMFLTVPFVVIAIWRYLYLVFRRNLGGAPESMLLRDRPLFLSILLWSVAVAIVLGS